MWSHVVRHFEQFLGELRLPDSDRADAEAKARRVAKSLFADYYPDQDFDPACYAIIGSFGKGTAAKPRTDVDLLFVLPATDWARINALTGNKQSQLLQEVKSALLGTYPNTDIRGDGPIVRVPFTTYDFEVCPVFRCTDGTLLTAHTNNGGSWKYTHPALEMQWIRNVDAAWLGKATDLVKMLKAWKRECNVEIKSVCLEIAAVYFVERWLFRDKTIYYYDWMMRDFFAFLLNYSIDGWAQPAGIQERIMLGDKWQTKCRTAYDRAVKACDFEREDKGYLASCEWRKIFGSQFEIDVADLLPPAILGIGSPQRL